MKPTSAMRTQRPTHGVSSKMAVTAKASSHPTSATRSGAKSLEADASRRAVLVGAPLLLAGLSTLSAAPVMAETAAVTAGSKMKELYDPILAYKFQYPVETVSGQPLRMILAHEPEKYSSAAPLTADARQRIVSELLDLRNFITVSMTVGPTSGILKEIGQDEWKPLDVALTVLIDRSTSRVSSGQRVAMNDVEEAHIENRSDGKRYFVYEHLSQGSPTPQELRRETYRHALAVTTVRAANDGTEYLYTLNLSCRESMWNDLRPLFEDAVQSFVLTEPTKDYVAPDVNPWQFW